MEKKKNESHHLSLCWHNPLSLKKKLQQKKNTFPYQTLISNAMFYVFEKKNVNSKHCSISS